VYFTVLFQGPGASYCFLACKMGLKEELKGKEGEKWRGQL
jgi:hypothetical protein